MELMNKYYNPNKNINSVCICGERTADEYARLSVLFPCEHIIHKRCKNLLINDICKLCKTKVKFTVDEDELVSIIKRNYKKNPVCYQYYIDLLSLKKRSVLYYPSMFYFVTRINTLISYIYDFMVMSDKYDDMVNFIDDILKLTNIKINVVGKENLIHTPKVYIANHSNLLDAFIMFKVFQCGFVASEIAKKHPLGKKATELMPILIVSRGNKTKGAGLTSQIYAYAHKVGSVCIFPEGSMTPQDIMIRFRTGAFNSGLPIQPVILKYNPFIHDDNYTKYMYCITAQKEINVTVKILPLEHQPFNQHKIARIRRDMARAGNIALSRVSNKDINDKKIKVGGKKQN